ncbi:MAG TPA: hypothetical protein DEF43_13760 [Chloroflexus aurantiacus]|nr:MAG: hypothetical protein D6716_02535 [Chloroflexota bacterium]HBW68200.1 hypothetical protein [Chloroflexus aurantiacus]
MRPWELAATHIVMRLHCTVLSINVVLFILAVSLRGLFTVGAGSKLAPTVSITLSPRWIIHDVVAAEKAGGRENTCWIAWNYESDQMPYPYQCDARPPSSMVGAEITLPHARQRNLRDATVRHAATPPTLHAIAAVPERRLSAAHHALPVTRMWPGQP